MAGEPKDHIKELRSRTPPPLEGVIDVGSNAIRFLIGYKNSEGGVTRVLKGRKPIRLGSEVFTQKLIPQNLIDQVVIAFTQFNRDFQRFRVHRVRAIATSAVRESQNKDDFLAQILDKTGITIEIIDGQQEAKLIMAAVRSKIQSKYPNLFIMDIGGGSVEFTLSSGNSLISTLSLPLGTIRTLESIKGEVNRKSISLQYEASLQIIEKFLQKAPKEFVFVGTGGNLECLGSLRIKIFNKVSINKIKDTELSQLVDDFFTLNSIQRIKRFNFRPDRNDVILPASLLTQEILKITKQKKVLIPGMGLREGLIACAKKS